MMKTKQKDAQKLEKDAEEQEALSAETVPDVIKSLEEQEQCPQQQQGDHSKRKATELEEGLQEDTKSRRRFNDLTVV